jgi:hypothetical protein
MRFMLALAMAGTLDPFGFTFPAALVPPGRQITSQAQGLNVLVFELKEILRIE